MSLGPCTGILPAEIAAALCLLFIVALLLVLDIGYKAGKAASVSSSRRHERDTGR